MASAPVEFTPAKIDAGSVVRDTTQVVEIRNFGATAVILSSITLFNIDNTTLSYAPTTINPGTSTTFSVTILANGNAVFPNAYLQIVFSGYDTVIYRITGYRFSFVNLKHNWAQPVTERLEWLTDVLTSRDGHEYRRSLRRYPRHFLRLNHVTRSDKERIDWDGTFYKAQAQRFGVIAWQDIARTNTALSPGATTVSFIPFGQSSAAAYGGGYDFVVGQHIGFYYEKEKGTGAAWYLYQITAINLSNMTFTPAIDVTVPAKTLMAPVRYGDAPPAISAARQNTINTMWDIEYRCLYDVQQDYGALNLRTSRYSDASTSDFPSYQGFPILALKADYAEPIQWTYARQTYIQDWILGTVRQTTWDAAPQNVERLEYLAPNRDRVRNFFGFLGAIRGRWKPFWRLTTGDDDFLLAQAASSGTNVIVVSAPDYARFYNLIASRLDLAIGDMRQQVLFTTKITGATSVGKGLFQLTLQNNLPVSITPQPSRFHISFLRFARLASDVVEVQWPRHDVAVFTLTVQDLQYGTTSYT